MEIVLLDDMQATHLTTWVRLANTTGHDSIKPGDEFKEVGALEEFSVEAVSFSPVPGASRIRLLRAHHASKPEVHKAGAVLAQTNGTTLIISSAHNGDTANNYMVDETGKEYVGGVAVGLAEPQPDAEISDTIIAGGTEYANPAKRGRGRPKGSPNKPKQPLMPTWPGVS